MTRILFSLLLSAALFSTACDDDDDVSSGNGTGVPSPPAGGLTATPLPRVDGTVPAQGFGGIESVAVKASPDPPPGIATLEDIRTGAHPEEGGWDRIVFEFRGVRPEGSVEYVTSDSQCGSGAAVSVPGSAILKVTFRGAQAHNDNGQSTIGPPFVVNRMVIGPGNAILGGEVSCDFEGVFSVALGIDARERFNVRFLDNPTRVVVDVKW